jgi:predicted RNA binding protein YcfA (HicA-like mRNA interferase family)
LLAAGFIEVGQRGSHVKFSRTTETGTRIAIIPHHNYDVPLGTLRGVLNQAGLTTDEFDRL